MSGRDPAPLTLAIPPALAGERLDRALAELSGLSRARVQALMAEGALTRAARPADKAQAGQTFTLAVPPARPALPDRRTSRSPSSTRTPT
jgi:23S rRNA pseudouridine1911/1915/1917 synthase